MQLVVERKVKVLPRLTTCIQKLRDDCFVGTLQNIYLDAIKVYILSRVSSSYIFFLLSGSQTT